MFPLFKEPIAGLSEQQKKQFGDLGEYFEKYQNSATHVELIVFTVQTMILQNDRFSEPDGELLTEKLGVAADYFSRVIQVADDLVRSEPGWYQRWKIASAAELDAHAKVAQKVYAHLGYLAEPPTHMQGWAIYALAKGLETALNLSSVPADWSSPGSFPPKSDEILIIEFLSQLVFRFSEYHHKPQ